MKNPALSRNPPKNSATTAAMTDSAAATRSAPNTNGSADGICSAVRTVRPGAA